MDKLCFFMKTALFISRTSDYRACWFARWICSKRLSHFQSWPSIWRLPWSNEPRKFHKIVLDNAPLRKIELFEITSVHKPPSDEKNYKIDNLIRSFGHTPLRTPPYMCQFNPIGLIWAQIKFFIGSRNTSGEFTLKMLNGITIEAINSITSDDWRQLPFAQKPQQRHFPIKRYTQSEAIAFNRALKELLDLGAVTKCQPMDHQFLSSFFLRKKQNGTMRFILFLAPHTSIWKTTDEAIPVHIRYRKYLRFLFEGNYYQFVCLPFGLLTAPFCFTKLLKPVVEKLRPGGTVTANYLDDFLIIGDTLAECGTNTQHTIDLLQKDEAANRPKVEFVPKTLQDLNIEGVSADGMNGTNCQNSLIIPSSHNNKVVSSYGSQLKGTVSKPIPIRHTFNPDPFDPWSIPQASPLPSPMKSPARTPMTKQPCCTALYDFEPENPGELGFKENDVITLLNKVDENWFEGSIQGRTGYFPVNYVRVDVPLP
nr:unnamed protein product [Callosobruchus chinensis]